MKAHDLTLGGILTALTAIVLYLTIVIPTNTLALLTLASVMVPIALMRTNLKTAWVVYIASTLVAFLLIPSNTALMYCLFFGCYGIVKYFIERKNHLPIEVLLKLIFFNIIFFIGFYLFKNLLGLNILNNMQAVISHFSFASIEKGPFVLLWFSGQIIFLIYDYALTLLIDLYRKYFKH